MILTGELGAGKTTLVQGIARGLGVTDHVVSPTFTLVREYHGRLEVAHVDVYRLERIQDVMDLGLEELGDGEAVLLVEWGDAVEEVLPADHVTIELTGAERRRRAPRWCSRRAGRPGSSAGNGWNRRLAPWSGGLVIVVGIDTSTPQTSVAIGTDVEVAGERLDRRQGPPGGGDARAASSSWRGPDVDLDRVGGIAVGIGPGLFTGLRVGVADGQDARPGAGRADRRASPASTRWPTRSGTRRRRIAAVVDARRGEVFSAIYRAVPGGVVRETDSSWS